jgi:ABC-type phosphate transport system ATPase subunit
MDRDQQPAKVQTVVASQVFAPGQLCRAGCQRQRDVFQPNVCSAARQAPGESGVPHCEQPLSALSDLRGGGLSTFVRTHQRMYDLIAHMCSQGKALVNALRQRMVFPYPHLWRRSLADNMVDRLQTRDQPGRRAFALWYGDMDRHTPFSTGQRLCLARPPVRQLETLLPDKRYSAPDPTDTLYGDGPITCRTRASLIVSVTYRRQLVARIWQYTGLFLHRQVSEDIPHAQVFAHLRQKTEASLYRGTALLSVCTGKRSRSPRSLRSAGEHI